MAITIAATETKGAYATSATITSDAVAIAIGNLVVVAVSAPDDMTQPSFSDSGGNVYTARTVMIRGTSCAITIGYCLSATVAGNLTVTATWAGATAEQKNIIVAVYAIDAGDTVTLDASSAGANNYNTAVDTADITTTGDDELVFCAVSLNATKVQSAQDIGGAATYIDADNDMIGAFYRILSATATLDATCTLATDAHWVTDFVSFKSTAAAGGGQALAGDVTIVSATSSLLPYTYHYLVDNTVVNQSSVAQVLPYIYHYLVDNVVAGVTSLYGNLTIIAGQVYQYLAGAVDAISDLPTTLPYIYRTLVNNVVSGISDLVGNLSIISGALRKLRIYMRIGGGRF